MKARAVLILALLAAAPAAREGPPLTMTCHYLLAGWPDPQGTTHELRGRNLYSRSAAGRTLISTEGRLVPLGRGIGAHGSVTLTFASHRRAGSVVTRRVFWQVGDGPRRLRFTERYDFARRRVTISGERGDVCHSNGGDASVAEPSRE